MIKADKVNKIKKNDKSDEALVEPLAANTSLDAYAIEKRAELPKINIGFDYYIKVGFIILFVVFGVLGIWSATAPLDSSAVASGEVVAASNNRTIQHLEGGIVADVLVKDGDIVAKHQVLVRLSSTQIEAELSIVEGRLAELVGIQARLNAEKLLKDAIEFPESLTDIVDEIKAKEIVLGNQAIFQARSKSLNAELKIYDKRNQGLRKQINGNEKLMVSLKQQTDSYKSEIEDQQALFKQQYIDKIRLQNMQRTLFRLNGQYAGVEAEIGQLKVRISETMAESVLREQKFFEAVVTELRSVQAELSNLQPRRVALLDRLARVTILSTVEGAVNGLNIYDAGEVISPGQKIMEIVPASESFSVKARVNVTDIDRIRIGQLTDVRLSAFNTQLTHVVEGKVVHISADNFVDERMGVSYFEARIELTKEGIRQLKADDMFLLPGMPADVMIKIGERTLLAYLLKPFSDMLARSFNEE